VKIGIMMASKSAVAMDLAVCKAIGVEPIGVHPLKAAKIRGLWPHEIEYPLLSPKDVRYKGFKLPDSASPLATGGKGGELSPRPSDKCIACGRCQAICPKGAIKVVGKRATVDYKLCIRCYCCHEICPADAIDLVKI
jgi:formate hydrogenlyase subunit 6/NADH:ubiquinone oxidoreductase subunit I